MRLAQLALEDNSDGLLLEENGDVQPEQTGQEPAAPVAPGPSAGGVEMPMTGVDVLGEEPAPLVGQRVMIEGLVGKPELNGLHGYARSYSAKTGRYGIKIDGRDGPLLSIKPANVVKSTKSALKARLEAETAADRRAAETAAEATGPTVEDISLRHEKALELRTAGRPNEAVTALTELLGTSRQALGREHAETLAITNNLSAMLQTVGKYAEATPFCLEVVERRRVALGERDTLFLNALTNLGSLYFSTGVYAKAVEVRRELLAARVETHGETDPAALAAMDALAAALAELDDGEGGAELLEAMRLKTAELCVHVQRFGKGKDKCTAQMPAESKATVAKLFQRLSLQPDSGQTIDGYHPLLAAIKAALLPDQDM